MKEMSCQNPEYQKFCANTYKHIPCCREIGRDSLSCVLLPGDDPEEESLILQSFELREIFLQKKMVKFHAQGICMYPCIHPNDVLCIEPRKAEQIKVGDIAVYRRSGHLIGHRTIGKGSDNGAAYILTSPDTARFGNDGPRFDKDILGVVSSIERNGKIVGTAKGKYSLAKKIIYGFSLGYYYIGQRLFRVSIRILGYIQRFKAYRKIAGFLFSMPENKINLSILAPLNIKAAGRFNKKISTQELVDLNLNMDKSSMSKWKIIIDVDSRQGAVLSFIFRPDTCQFHGWWLVEAKIMLRYRGTRIEEILLAQAKELLRLSAIPLVYSCDFKDPYLERMFFKNKMPFVRVIREKEIQPLCFN